MISKKDPAIINVLITGAAGNLAHFIWTALMKSHLKVRVVGCNYDPDGVGLFQFDVGYIVPPAKSQGYVEKILKICREERIQIIMVGNMAELRVLAENKDHIKKEGAFVVASPINVLQKLDDKWELIQFLKDSGFAYPRSVLPGQGMELEQFLDEIPFPYVVKDRFGAGSQNVAVVRNKKQLSHAIESVPNALIQEYIYPDNEEYTIGVFLCSNGKPAASIVVKRQINLGMSWKAQVLPESPIGDYCERVLAGSGCIGPCNVQLRVNERGPIIFEVNPRFSTTASARAHYGYNETEMCIRHFVLHKEIERPVIRSGRFYRVIEDFFVSENEYELLKKEGKIENRNKDRESDKFHEK